MKNRTYRYFTGEPLFAFGYGLSYTRFEFGEASLSCDSIGYGETVVLTVPLSNVGKRDGEETVQVYIRKKGDAEGPLKTLRNFRKVMLAKGETKEVEIALPYESFEWFDAASNTMRPTEGEYEVFYGSSSRDEDLRSLVVRVVE